VESGDAELIAELLLPLSDTNQLVVLASVTADTLKRVMRSLQNEGNLAKFLLKLRPLSSFTLLDKLGQSDLRTDNSQFYTDLWSREPAREALIATLLALKKSAVEQAAQKVIAAFFSS
jgi:hypothetical protein